MASGIQALIERGRMKSRSNKQALDKRFSKPTVKASQVKQTFSTRGKWTKSITYNPEEGEVTVVFKNGFTAVYPNITMEKYRSMFRGATTKGKPRRNDSVGAWLHQHPNVMFNYRAGKK
jgi:hypothetical protein